MDYKVDKDSIYFWASKSEAKWKNSTFSDCELLSQMDEMH
jgi:hypothetical protein